MSWYHIESHTCTYIDQDVFYLPKVIHASCLNILVETMISLDSRLILINIGKQTCSLAYTEIVNH